MPTQNLTKTTCLKSSLLVLVLIISGCVFRSKPVEPRIVYEQPPIDEVKIPKRLDILNPIPRSKYQIFKPGEQTINVGKPAGYYFPAPNFGWLMKREEINKIWSEAVLKNIEKANTKIKEWKTDDKNK
jgi:hypothetical protein